MQRVRINGYMLSPVCPSLQVFDVTEFVSTHPGGASQLLRGAGKDCTELFYFAHPWIPAGYGVRTLTLAAKRCHFRPPASPHTPIGSAMRLLPRPYSPPQIQRFKALGVLEGSEAIVSAVSAPKGTPVAVTERDDKLSEYKIDGPKVRRQPDGILWRAACVMSKPPAVDSEVQLVTLWIMRGTALVRARNNLIYL
jgi:hypothetical protein